MTVYGFIALDEQEQIEFIWSQEAIASRQEDDLQVELYQIDDGYIEVFSGEKAYIRIRPFKTTELLAPYLDQIKINFPPEKSRHN